MSNTAKATLVAGTAIILVATVGAAGVGAETDGRWPVELGPLSGQQNADDVLPEFVSDERVDPASTRLVLDGDDASHWAALSHTGQVCLITHLPRAEVAGSACAEPDRFRESGVDLFVASAMDDTPSEARLVPDGYSAASIGWQKAAPNLLVREPADRDRPKFRDAVPDSVSPQRGADAEWGPSVTWHTYYEGNLYAGDTIWSSSQYLSEARVLASLGWNGDACTAIYEYPSYDWVTTGCGGDYPGASTEDPILGVAKCWWNRAPYGREGPLAMQCDWGS